LNVDVSGLKNEGFSLGGVIRNDSGGFVATFSTISHSRDVDVAKVEALVMSMNVYRTLKLPTNLCEVETNSLNLVNTLKGKWHPFNFFAGLWKDLTQIEVFYSILFIEREKNSIVNEVTREGIKNCPWCTTKWSQLSKRLKGLCRLNKLQVSNFRSCFMSFFRWFYYQ
jgi:hypothetical protein